MGSVTERVARYAPCPVLTVRARGTHEEIGPHLHGRTRGVRLGARSSRYVARISRLFKPLDRHTSVDRTGGKLRVLRHEAHPPI